MIKRLLIVLEIFITILYQTQAFRARNQSNNLLLAFFCFFLYFSLLFSTSNEIEE